MSLFEQSFPFVDVERHHPVTLVDTVPGLPPHGTRELGRAGLNCFRQPLF
jgi:hypothetical protein